MQARYFDGRSISTSLLEDFSASHKSCSALSSFLALSPIAYSFAPAPQFASSFSTTTLISLFLPESAVSAQLFYSACSQLLNL